MALVVFLLVMAGSGWFVYTYALGTRQQGALLEVARSMKPRVTRK